MNKKRMEFPLSWVTGEECAEFVNFNSRTSGNLGCIQSAAATSMLEISKDSSAMLLSALPTPLFPWAWIASLAPLHLWASFDMIKLGSF